MIQTIQPREYFPISRMLPDPNDSATYYLRAVVRNATSGVTLSTVNLLTQGNHIYANSYQAPADSSGRGLFITITTTVYTDSGYTTKSAIHAEESDTFVVYDRFNFAQIISNIVNSLQTGNDVDYKKIKKIFREVLDAQEKPEPKPVDLTPVISTLSRIEEAHLSLKTSVGKLGVAVGDIKIPEYEKTSLEPVFAGMKALKAEIMSAIEAAKAGPVDFSPILSRLEKYMTENTVSNLARELKASGISESAEKTKEIIGFFEKLRDSVKETMALTSTLSGKKVIEAPETPPAPRINKYNKLIPSRV